MLFIEGGGLLEQGYYDLCPVALASFAVRHGTWSPTRPLKMYLPLI